MFSLLSVCLSVCPSDNWKSCERILTKFLGGVGHRSGANKFTFGYDSDHSPDPWVRSPKSVFTRLSTKLPTDFDEISWKAGVWPRDQLITFWWRSESLSGPGSPFRITIRIREELPRWQHTEQMPCKNHSAILLCWRSAEVCALWVLLVLNNFSFMYYFVLCQLIIVSIFFCFRNNSRISISCSCRK